MANTLQFPSGREPPKTFLDHCTLPPQEMQTFLKYGTMSLLTVGLLHVSRHLAQKSHGDNEDTFEFEDRVESLHTDPSLQRAFRSLQEYRNLNPWLFTSAILNTDHLLFLEQALTSEQVLPTRNDKNLAFSHFRLAATRLRMFQECVKDKLGVAHAVTVNSLVKQIYIHLQGHFTAVLNVCTNFNPTRMLKEARRDIEALGY
jgi:hypothetical protein